MTQASEVLAQAASIVSGSRQRAYGPPERNFATIAAMWSVYLGQPVTAAQVAWMMVLLKTARAASGSGSEDNAIDAAGYAALAGELTE